jgi:hypothetical protein
MYNLKEATVALYKMRVLHDEMQWLLTAIFCVVIHQVIDAVNQTNSLLQATLVYFDIFIIHHKIFNYEKFIF